MCHFFSFVVLLSIILIKAFVTSQKPLFDATYRVISVANGGFLTVCLKDGVCQSADWLPVCMSSDNSALITMQSFVCRKYGYDPASARLSASTQSICGKISCPYANSQITACTAYTTPTASTVAYVMCYSNICPVIGQQLTTGNTMDCDYENNDSCGWTLQNWLIQSGQDPDHTLGSTKGHMLVAPACNKVVSYSTIVSGQTIGCTGCQQVYCFTFYAMNTGDQPPMLYVSVVYSPTSNDTLFAKNSAFDQAFTMYSVKITVTKSFKLAVSTYCALNSTSKLMLDDFLLTSGECPTPVSVCYNGGKSTDNNDKCQCQSNSIGRACELNFCNTLSTCLCSEGGVNWLLIGGISLGIIVLVAVIVVISVLVTRFRKLSV